MTDKTLRGFYRQSRRDGGGRVRSVLVAIVAWAIVDPVTEEIEVVANGE